MSLFPEAATIQCPSGRCLHIPVSLSHDKKRILQSILPSVFRHIAQSHVPAGGLHPGCLHATLCFPGLQQ